MVAADPTRTSSPADVLKELGGALSREAHNLVRRPDLLWPQVYNRAQWGTRDTNAALACEFAERTATGAEPWMRVRTPYRESRALVQTLVGHVGSVAACAVTPDGRGIVSGGADGAVRIWNFATGRERLAIQAHGAGVSACAMSPDGRLLATTGGDGALALRDARSGELRWTVAAHRSQSPHPQGALDCAFSPDGATVVSVGEEYDGCGRLWDVATGEQIGTFEPDGLPIMYRCVVSPSGALVAATAQDGRVRTWRVPDGAERIFDAEHGSSGLDVSGSCRVACAAGPDGETLLTAGDDGVVRLWDLASGAQRAVLADESAVHTSGPHELLGMAPDAIKHVLADSGASRSFGEMASRTLYKDGTTAIGVTEEILRHRHFWQRYAARFLDCAFTPDGRRVVVASGDGTLRVLDAATGELAATLVGHSEQVLACAVSPDGAFVVSGSGDGTVKIWDLAEAEPSGGLVGHRLPVWDVAVSPDGSLAASASADETIELFNPLSDAPRRRLTGHTDSVYACAFSSDGALMMSGGNDAAVKVWDLASGRERATFVGHSAAINSCAFAPDATVAASAAASEIKLWDLATSAERTSLTCAAEVLDCAFVPTTGELVMACADGGVHVWDPETGTERLTLAASGAATCCAISADGARLAAGGRDGGMRIWAAADGEELSSVAFHEGLQGVAFSPDGALLFGVTEGGFAAAWDLEHDRSLASILLPASPLCLAAHPRLPLVLCGDAGGAVHVIELLGLQVTKPAGEEKEVPHGRRHRLFGRRHRA